MIELITRTRIQPPRRRPDILSRERLLQIFSQMLSSKLVLVIAPAGYGKTLALVDLIHHIDMPVCWYSVGPADHETHRFVNHFVAALAGRFPAIDGEAQAAVLSFAAGHGTLEQIAITLVNLLNAHARSDFLFVVDDYHLIGDNQEINRFVSLFAQQSDDHCHLALSSRALLDLPDLALMLARGQVVGLDLEALAFQPDELQMLAQRNYGVELNAIMAQEMIAATEGWITGLLLSGAAQQWQKASLLHPVRASGVTLHTYLSEQVLDRQPSSVREFMLRSSLMDEIDAKLCEVAFDVSWLRPGESWQSLIDSVLQSNLFALPIGELGDGLRYHHLFQDFLQQQLAAERPQEERLILQRLVAAYVDRQQWEQAHILAKRLNDPSLIAWVIEQAGLPLLRAGRILLLAKWLDDVPTLLLSDRSRLLSLKGYNLVRLGRVEAGRRLLDQACNQLGREPQVQGALAETLVYRSIAHRLLGVYPDSLRDADSALNLIDQFGAGHGAPPDVPALAKRCKGLALCMMGALDAGIDWLQRALVAYQADDDVQNIAAVSMEIAIAYANSGQNEEALTLFRQAHEAWQRLHNLVGQANVLNSLGVHYHQLGKYEEALDALVEALACARRSGYARMEAFALASLGDVFVDLDLWQVAHEVYEQSYRIAQRIDERFLLLYVQLAQASLAWSTGHWDIAYVCLDEVGRMVLDHNSSYEWGLYRQAMGRFYLAQGNVKAALEPLSDALACFMTGGQFPDAARTEMLQALALWELGQQAQAEASLQDALRTINELELRHPIIVAASIVAQELAVFLRNGNIPALDRLLREVDEFVAELPALRRNLRQKAGSVLPTVHLGEPTLVIRSLGRAEATVSGRRVTSRDWKTKSARDLFFCFLAHPYGLTKEEVGALFWPDCSPDQLKSRFKNAVYRLRSALGRDVILFADELYRFDHSIDYEYDVESFRKWLKEAYRSRESQHRITALQHAVDLYAGPYLADVDAPWASLEREQLRRMYVDATTELAQLYFEQGEMDRSLNCCQRLLSEDPCLEDAHRLAMRIYASTGNRAGVARQYAMCQKYLEEEIAAPPSPLTEELYVTLMR